MPITAPVATLIAGGLSAGASIFGANESRDAAESAASRIYEPGRLTDADALAYKLIEKQAGQEPYWPNYEPISNSMLQAYMNMIGQTYSPQQTQATINPQWQAWQDQYTGQAGTSGGGNAINQLIIRGLLGFGGPLSSTPLPFSAANKNQNTGQGLINPYPQYMTAPTGGAGTSAVAGTQTPAVNIMEYLNQYLTGAMTPYSSDIYNTYLGRAVQGTRSGLTARGLNTSPYGAGIEADTSREFARQWALDEQNRQGVALQNYLQGQGNLQALGSGALESALALQQLKQNWSQPAISNALQYMGMGVNSGAAQANALSSIGQNSANAWANVGTSLNDLVKNWTPSTNTYTQDQLNRAAAALEP